LGIWQEVRTQGGLPAKVLKQTFKENLFKGIFEQTNGQQADDAANGNSSLDLKMIDKLDNYAVERWESVLKYIVNPKDPNNQVCKSTKDVLKFAGLMKSTNENNADDSQSGENDEDESVVLTASAFQFLLWNRRLQIWYFTIQLLEYFWQKKNQDLSECLTLLFELSFATFGRVGFSKL
jgi:hypothetical protein